MTNYSRATRATIIKGTLSPNCCLYTVSLTSTSVTYIPQSPSALYAAHMPDVKTWHHCLGHCNMQSIVDMACRGVTKGMAIDLTSTPPKCIHCVLGKQMCLHIPKIQKGLRAVGRLERVYVDLYRPMPYVLCSGCLYAMHVIDDFLGYIWSLPLRSKGDMASMLQLWHKHVTAQTGLSLKTLITDNGELISKSMKEWCLSLSIDYLVTTPYISAQNGCTKHAHCTILGKAQAMRLVYNAPPSFWDEFCAMAAYLTNFTSTPALGHKTAYKA